MNTKYYKIFGRKYKWITASLGGPDEREGTKCWNSCCCTRNLFEERSRVIAIFCVGLSSLCICNRESATNIHQIDWWGEGFVVWGQIKSGLLQALSTAWWNHIQCRPSGYFFFTFSWDLYITPLGIPYILNEMEEGLHDSLNAVAGYSLQNDNICAFNKTSQFFFARCLILFQESCWVYK